MLRSIGLQFESFEHNLKGSFNFPRMLTIHLFPLFLEHLLANEGRMALTAIRAIISRVLHFSLNCLLGNESFD